MVPSRYWRAEVDEIERARLERAFAVGRRPVVDDGAVRARGRDGVEADLLELARLAAAIFEPHGGGDLVDLARVAHLVEPGEEARHGHAVAQVRGARALDLRRVLDGLGQDAGIGAGDEFGAFRLERLGKADRRRFRVEPHPRFGLSQRRERSAMSVAGSAMSRNSSRSPRTLPPTLAASMNRVGRPFAGTMAKASATGVWRMSPPRMLNSQAMESSMVRSTASAFSSRSSVCTSRILSCALRPANSRPWGTIGAEEGFGRSCHKASIGLPATGSSLMPALPKRLGQALDLLDRVQRGVVADRRALAELSREPARGLGLGRLQYLEQGGVGLRLGLQDVAAVDEQRRRLVQHDRHACRSGEAGEPGEPLSRWGQELVLVLVAMGDEEALELSRLQFPLQRLDPFAAGARGTHVIETLIHGRLL